MAGRARGPDAWDGGAARHRHVHVPQYPSAGDCDRRRVRLRGRVAPPDDAVVARVAALTGELDLVGGGEDAVHDKAAIAPRHREAADEEELVLAVLEGLDADPPERGACLIAYRPADLAAEQQLRVDAGLGCPGAHVQQ